MEDLLELRKNIDIIDNEIVELYERRMKISEQVAEYKIATGKKYLIKAVRTANWRHYPKRLRGIYPSWDIRTF